MHLTEICDFEAEGLTLVSVGKPTFKMNSTTDTKMNNFHSNNKYRKG